MDMHYFLPTRFVKSMAPVGQTIRQSSEYVDQLIHFIGALAEEKPRCGGRRLLEGPVTGDLVA